MPELELKMTPATLTALKAPPHWILRVDAEDEAQAIMASEMIVEMQGAEGVEDVIAALEDAGISAGLTDPEGAGRGLDHASPDAAALLGSFGMDLGSDPDLSGTWGQEGLMQSAGAAAGSRIAGGAGATKGAGGEEAMISPGLTLMGTGAGVAKAGAGIMASGAGVGPGLVVFVVGAALFGIGAITASEGLGLTDLDDSRAGSSTSAGAAGDDDSFVGGQSNEDGTETYGHSEDEKANSDEGDDGSDEGDDGTDDDGETNGSGEDGGTSTGGQSNEDGTTTGGSSEPADDADGGGDEDAAADDASEEAPPEEEAEGGSTMPAEGDGDEGKLSEEELEAIIEKKEGNNGGTSTPDGNPEGSGATPDTLEVRGPTYGQTMPPDGDEFVFHEVVLEGRGLDPLILVDPEHGGGTDGLPPEGPGDPSYGTALAEPAFYGDELM